MAVRVASAAGLRNAATCEFLYDTDGRFWFLEVNTRLQVEHGVTELVTGLDIVREQFWLAAGAALSDGALAAAALAATPSSHAIEVRLSAEDPAREFAPAPGRVTRWVMPAGPGVRVDTALEPGERIPPDYDPLIAKLMVHAADRPAAIERLRRALDELDIGGVQTTQPFDRFVVREPSFRAGELSTGWVPEHWDGSRDRSDAVRRALLAAASCRSRVRRAARPVPREPRPERLPTGRPPGLPSAGSQGERMGGPGHPAGGRPGSWPRTTGGRHERAAHATERQDRWAETACAMAGAGSRPITAGPPVDPRAVRVTVAAATRAETTRPDRGAAPGPGGPADGASRRNGDPRRDPQPGRLPTPGRRGRGCRPRRRRSRGRLAGDGGVPDRPVRRAQGRWRCCGGAGIRRLRAGSTRAGRGRGRTLGRDEAGARSRAPPGIRRIVVREVVVDGWRVEVELEPERRASLRERARRASDVAGRSGPVEVHAIIPGRIVALSVAPGDAVVAGQQLLVLEAMKMQNELRAPREGSIERIPIAVGENVEVGDLLMVIS